MIIPPPPPKIPYKLCSSAEHREPMELTQSTVWQVVQQDAGVDGWPTPKAGTAGKGSKKAPASVCCTTYCRAGRCVRACVCVCVAVWLTGWPADEYLVAQLHTSKSLSSWEQVVPMQVQLPAQHWSKHLGDQAGHQVLPNAATQLQRLRSRGSASHKRCGGSVQQVEMQYCVQHHHPLSTSRMPALQRFPVQKQMAQTCSCRRRTGQTTSCSIRHQYL